MEDRRYELYPHRPRSFSERFRRNLATTVTSIFRPSDELRAMREHLRIQKVWKRSGYGQFATHSLEAALSSPGQTNGLYPAERATD